MRKIHFMSAALMAILVTSMGGLQNASALMGTDVIPAGGILDFREVIDGSGSVTATTFNNVVIPATIAAFTSALGPDQFGKVRVSVIQFSTGAVLECVQMINSAADVVTLNTCVGNIVYQNGGATDIAAAYDLVTVELGNSPVQGVNDRSIVDLVTDGNHNASPDAVLATAFANALAAGLDSSVVLGVGGVDVAALQTLVHPNPPGPLFNPLMANDVLPDPLVQGFVIIIANFADFADALEQKFAIIVVDDVGGELLDINTAALLVAGAQANAVWLMSALAVIGSVAFGALYIKSRKH